jgi:SAM-dependent methyltransferase
VSPGRLELIPSGDPSSNEALIEKYGAVAYASQSNAQSHPERLATIASLYGLSPPPLATCRVLELGCSDGANILPMAAGLPDASFVGCDLSPQAIASGRAAIAGTGLANLTLVESDLRDLPVSLGEFDYIIAHGVYSWVPPGVRDGLFALAARRLSPNGLLFVSYNVYPGCHVRQAAWEALHHHIRQIEDARSRLDAARTLAAAMAEPGIAQDETDGLLRREFARIARQTDSSIYHDDLAIPNDPVYFHEFAAHAQRHGLTFVSEAKPFHSSGLGVARSMQRLMAGLGRLEREQYLDFAGVRRFRQSVLCRAEHGAALAPAPERVAQMHAAASHSLMGAVERGKPLFNPVRPPLEPADGRKLHAALTRLLEIAPRALPVADIESDLAVDANVAPGARTRSMAALLFEACFADEVVLHVQPPRVSERPSARPLASPVVRWQASRGRMLTNLCHEPLQIPEGPPRALLALLDGKRDHADLDVAIGAALGVDDPAARRQRIDGYVRQFGRLGLLIQ